MVQDRFFTGRGNVNPGCHFSHLRDDSAIIQVVKRFFSADLLNENLYSVFLRAKFDLQKDKEYVGDITVFENQQD